MIKGGRNKNVINRTRKVLVWCGKAAETVSESTRRVKARTKLCPLRRNIFPFKGWFRIIVDMRWEVEHWVMLLLESLTWKSSNQWWQLSSRTKRYSIRRCEMMSIPTPRVFDLTFMRSYVIYVGWWQMKILWELRAKTVKVRKRWILSCDSLVKTPAEKGFLSFLEQNQQRKTLKSF